MIFLNEKNILNVLDTLEEVQKGDQPEYFYTVKLNRREKKLYWYLRRIQEVRSILNGD